MVKKIILDDHFPLNDQINPIGDNGVLADLRMILVEGRQFQDYETKDEFLKQSSILLRESLNVERIHQKKMKFYFFLLKPVSSKNRIEMYKKVWRTLDNKQFKYFNRFFEEVLVEKYNEHYYISVAEFDVNSLGYILDLHKSYPYTSLIFCTDTLIEKSYIVGVFEKMYFSFHDEESFNLDYFSILKSFIQGNYFVLRLGDGGEELEVGIFIQKNLLNEILIK